MNSSLFWYDKVARVIIGSVIALLPFAIHKYIATFGDDNFNFQSLFVSPVDCLSAFLFLVTLCVERRKFLKFIIRKEAFLFGILLLSSVVAGALYHQSTVYVSVAMGAKLLLAFSLFLSLRWHIDRGTINGKIASRIFVVAMIAQATLMIGQFGLQKNITSRYLGESTFNGAMSGVAKIESEEGKFVRAYGTFPHPNLAGAFFVIALACAVLFPLSQRFWARYLIICVLVLGLAMTFSRTAVGVGIALLAIILLWRKQYTLLLASALFIFTISYILSPLLIARIHSDQGQSFPLRNFLTVSAVQMVATHPWFGVGLGQYIPELERTHDQPLEQFKKVPVDNAYLLLLAETGIFGFGLFLSAIMIIIFRKKITRVRGLVLCAIGVLALFDHYFLSLDQGRYLFFAVLAFL